MNMNIKESDVKLYEYIHDHYKEMVHNELFYALLEWKDQHPEIREVLAKKYDTYVVKWYEEDTKSAHEVRHTTETSSNPFRSAQMVFQRLGNPINSNVSCAEFWHEANCYGTELSRNSILIDSFERKETK